MLRSRPSPSLGKAQGLTTPNGIAWCAILLITLATAAIVHSELLKGLLSDSRHLASDFIVFWTAARSVSPYDFEALTQAQHWYMSTQVLRPFAYPPSFIPWLEPFARLPMWQAYLLWTGATAALFTMIWSRVTGMVPALAGLAAPIAVFAAVPGQMIFLLGALVVGGVTLLERRPLVAGLLLGVAATIKPQALLLIPFALAASGQWRALAAAIGAGAAVGATCVLFQGAGLWLAWADAVPRFLEVLRDTGMIDYGVTPASWLERAGFEGMTAASAKLALALVGVVSVCLVFRSSHDVRHRLLALTSGTLLVLPYGMPYELAAAAPAAASLLLDRRQAPFIWFACFAFLTAAGQTLALVLMAGAMTWLAIRPTGSDSTGGVGAEERGSMRPEGPARIPVE